MIELVVEVLFVVLVLAASVILIWRFSEVRDNGSVVGMLEKPADRLRDSKNHFFFDGENEYYREAMSRVRGNVG